MTKLTLLLAGLVCVASLSRAQTGDLTTLQSRGTLDSLFTTSSETKYNARLSTLGDSTLRRFYKSRQVFYRESSFGLDQYLKSGRVFNADQAGVYINKIIDALLADDPEWQGRITGLVASNPIPNAFATEDGVIVVNTGLLSRVRNEAELAYVLCHEITHIQKRHLLNLVDTFSNPESNYEEEKDYVTLKAGVHSFSRANEMEADSAGLSLFRKSGYNTFAALRVFDVLDSAVYIPQARLDLSQLAGGRAFLSTEVATDSTLELSTVLHDSKTHPAVGIRRDTISAKLSGRPGSTKPYYLIAEDEFKRVRNLAAVENVLASVREGAFTEALVHYAHLKEKGVDIPFVDRHIAFALAALSQEDTEYFNPANTLGGEHEVLLQALLSYVEREELEFLILACLAEFEAKHVDEPKEAAYYVTLQHDLFRKWGETERVALVDDVMEWQNLPDSDSAYWEAFLIDEAVLEAIAEGERKAEWEAKRDSLSGKEVSRDFYKRLRKGIGFECDELVLLNPLIIDLQYHRPFSLLWDPEFPNERPRLKSIRGERKRIELLEAAESYIEHTGMKFQGLDTHAMGASDVEQFAKMQAVSNWVNLLDAPGDIHLTPPNADRVFDMFEGGKNRYVMQVFAISLSANRTGSLLSLVPTAFMPPLMWPHMVIRSFTRRHEYVFVTFVYDMEQGRLAMVHHQEQDLQRLSQARLKNLVFQMLRQFEPTP